MNKKSKTSLVVLLLLLLLGGGLWFYMDRQSQTQSPPVPADFSNDPFFMEEGTPGEEPSLEDVVETPLPSPTPIKSVPPKVTKKQPTPPSIPIEKPSPVQIFKELIPKDIEIVRVYYVSQIMGPGTNVDFDINGSGFTKEFEKMITVRSGNAHVAIKNLSLVTPNQIHGTLAVDPITPTGVSFPEVLIADKVVFQAPDPFAVIQPGEVLNLIITDMGETGWTGQFRMFTNLTPQMFDALTIKVATPTIAISNISAKLPFIVEGQIIISANQIGNHDLIVMLGEKEIWRGKNFVSLVKPNVGQSGLVHGVKSQYPFYRPGDVAKFMIQGSGFQSDYTTLLRAVIDDFPNVIGDISYLSAGRLGVAYPIPSEAKPKYYTLKIMKEDEILSEAKNLFKVVPENWVRELRLDPAITPGGKGLLLIEGRSLSKEFVESITIEVDTPKLTVGTFKWVSEDQGAASISATADILPGDYLIKLTSKGEPVIADYGNVIRITE